MVRFVVREIQGHLNLILLETQLGVEPKVLLFAVKYYFIATDT